MILLQLSAGQGPIECCFAVGLALKKIESDSATKGLKLTIVEAIPGNKKGCYKSVMLKLEGKDAEGVADLWDGAIQWTQQSPFRPGHKRKNWFINGRKYQLDEASFDNEISFQACRASGAGGQHVNTTDSAVRATHKSSGISVRVESERSQHANKRLARALIQQKLEALQEQHTADQNRDRWQQHWELERGNPIAVYKGMKFTSA